MMKTNNYDDDESVSLLSGPVSKLAVILFFICAAFITYVFVSIFSE